jgi:uncharacterized membrane protein YeaQ/YmgE (transglycosylase-associated protein family)
MTIEQVVIWIVIGGIAGIIADWLVGGLKSGLIGAIVVGILGAFIGGWLFSVLHISAGSGFVGEVIQALVGAVVLLLILRALRRI